MSVESVYKQIVRYMDELHQDIGQLVVLIERLMEEEGYAPLPAAGNRSSWGLSSSILSPGGWRVPNLSRFYAPAGEELLDTSLMYLIALEADTVFPFPVMLCARITHPPLPESEIYTVKVWHANQLRTLAQEQPSWRKVGEERGWFVAEPSFNSAITTLRGYFLNLFDLVDRKHVIDNVVLPLTTSDAALDELLTVPKYHFVGSKDD